MSQILTLMTLMLGLLSALAYADGMSVTFTLKCDSQASATLSPVGNGNDFTNSIYVASAEPGKFYSCGIYEMSCDGTHGGNKTVTATCRDIPFVPVGFLTSSSSNASTLAVSNRKGDNACMPDSATLPSTTECNGPGPGTKGATLSASSPQ